MRVEHSLWQRWQPQSIIYIYICIYMHIYIYIYVRCISPRKRRELSYIQWFSSLSCFSVFCYHSICPYLSKLIHRHRNYITIAAAPVGQPWKTGVNVSQASINSSPLDKMAVIPQTSFSNVFSCVKKFDFWLKFHCSLFLRVPLTITQHWFRWWLDAE